MMLSTEQIDTCLRLLIWSHNKKSRFTLYVLEIMEQVKMEFTVVEILMIRRHLSSSFIQIIENLPLNRNHRNSDK